MVFEAVKSNEFTVNLYGIVGKSFRDKFLHFDSLRVNSSEGTQNIEINQSIGSNFFITTNSQLPLSKHISKGNYVKVEGIQNNSIINFGTCSLVLQHNDADDIKFIKENGSNLNQTSNDNQNGLFWLLLLVALIGIFFGIRLIILKCRKMNSRLLKEKTRSDQFDSSNVELPGFFSTNIADSSEKRKKMEDLGVKTRNDSISITRSIRGVTYFFKI